MVRVIKKDHTREAFNIQKVVTAVNKSANRVLYTFTDDELKSICDHVEGYIRDHAMTDVQIWQMHNIVESALEAVRPEVAKSYRDYRNYKQDFVGMLDSVYKKSQSIMYIGDKRKFQHRFRARFHQAQPDLQSAQQGAVPEVLHEHRGASGLPRRLHLRPRHVCAPRHDELLSVRCEARA